MVLSIHIVSSHPALPFETPRVKEKKGVCLDMLFTKRRISIDHGSHLSAITINPCAIEAVLKFIVQCCFPALPVVVSR